MLLTFTRRATLTSAAIAMSLTVIGPVPNHAQAMPQEALSLGSKSRSFRDFQNDYNACGRRNQCRKDVILNCIRHFRDNHGIGRDNAKKKCRPLGRPDKYYS